MTRRQLSPLGVYVVSGMASKDLSQAEVARLLGASQSSLSRWLRGETLPIDSDVLRRLAKLLDLDVNRVLILAHRRASANTYSDEPKIGYEPDPILLRLYDLLRPDSKLSPLQREKLRDLLEACVGLAVNVTERSSPGGTGSGAA